MAAARAGFAAIAIACASGALATAQQPPRFEVVSVKACDGVNTAPERGGPGVNASPDRLHIPCQTVMNDITWAYVTWATGRFHPFWRTNVEGGPSWASSAYYDINAKAESPQPRGTLNGPMLQALLEDRFQLKLHRVTREVPVFALKVAARGAKLRPHKDGSCAVVDLENAMAPSDSHKSIQLQCGVGRSTLDGTAAFGFTMQDLCDLFLGVLERPVIDRTGIAGMYDMHLDLTPADMGHGVTSPDGPADGAQKFAAIRAALRKLGLSLEAAKGPQEVLVIDSIARPAEN
jgi:uncharacterized protein (TIGR03435 family)